MKRKIQTYIDFDTGTTYIQGKKGLMKGRKKAKLLGDGTPVVRVKSNYNSYHKGEIIGRRESIFSAPKSRRKRELGLARASLRTRRRVASMGGKARRK